MKRWLPLIAVVLLCVFVNSCFGKKTCGSGDLDCYLENINFISYGGTVTQPVLISTAAVPTPADGGTAPTITNQPPPMQFTSTNTVSIEVDWSDPQGAQPAFCMKLCSPRVRCTARSACTRSVHDGFTSGVWRSFMGFKAEPADSTTTDQFEAHITPVSASGGREAVDLMQSSSGGSSGGPPRESGRRCAPETPWTSARSTRRAGSRFPTACCRLQVHHHERASSDPMNESVAAALLGQRRGIGAARHSTEGAPGRAPKNLT